MQNNILENLYTYCATVIDVHDGDTITVNIDLGLNTWQHGVKIRFSRINAPEINTDDGRVSYADLHILLMAKQVIIQTEKDKREKYGRLLGEVWIKDGEEWVNVNNLMVARGLATYRKY